MTSNVFAMFDQTQIQEFKEAFNMIDSNHDQIIDADDLREVYKLKIYYKIGQIFCFQLLICYQFVFMQVSEKIQQKTSLKQWSKWHQVQSTSPCF